MIEIKSAFTTVFAVPSSRRKYTAFAIILPAFAIIAFGGDYLMRDELVTNSWGQSGRRR
jgi:hypothetical protein